MLKLNVLEGGKKMKKRWLSCIKIFALAVFLTCSNVLLVHAANPLYGQVKDISNADSVWNKEDGYSVDITGNETQNVVMRFGEIKVNTLPEQNNRPSGYAWLGFHISAPASKGDTAKVKFGDGSTEDYSDGDYYVGINADKLLNAVKQGKNIEYKFYFDWANDGTYEQTVTIIIDPYKVTLTENRADGSLLWNRDIALKNTPIDEVPDTGITHPSKALLSIVVLMMGSLLYGIKPSKSRS